MASWDPRQYERFKAERAQPFWDLAALLDPGPAPRLVDLGCGTAESRSCTISGSTDSTCASRSTPTCSSRRAPSSSGFERILMVATAPAAG